MWKKPNDEFRDMIAIKDPDEEAIMKYLDFHPQYGSNRVEKVIDIVNLAIRRSLSLDVIRRLLDCYPECGTYLSHRRCNILHDTLLYCEAEVSYVIFCEVLSRNINAVNVYDRSGSLPLHIECSFRCRLDFIVKLLEINPDTIKSVGKDGMTAFHIAMLNPRCPHDVIMKLVELNPESIETIGRDCKTLYIALSNLHSSIDTILHIINLYPGAVRTSTGKSGLPLHIECKGLCRHKVIVKLLEIYPEAIAKGPER